MKYSFSEFNLNTKSIELHFNDELIALTKQNFELLELLVKNPNKVFSKDTIIEELWNGRVVNENTVDKSISKLRKILNSYKKDEYIKTVYGKGFKFAQEVSIEKDETDKFTSKNSTSNANSKYKYLLLALSISVLIISVIILFKETNKPISKQEEDSPVVLIMPAENKTDEQWLNQSTDTLIKQVFSFTTNTHLKQYADKPRFLAKEDYLKNQWQISPQLKVVTTQIVKQDDNYVVEIKISDKSKPEVLHTFKHEKLSSALKLASLWLTSEFKYQGQTAHIDKILPKEPYLIELYMHGLASYAQNKFSKAEHFFKLCLEESEDFILARLQLAKVKYAQGDMDTALSLLDTIDNKPTTPQIAISSKILRGSILDNQGKHQIALDMLLKTLKKYKMANFPQLDDVRYRLSFIYRNLSQFKQALSVLEDLEKRLNESDNIELLADVLQHKASLLQKIGKTKQAEIAAKKSLNTFEKLKDLLGEAKIHNTIARIKNHQSKFDESIMHLNKSLAITRSVDFKLGIGANLNELIYVYMAQGEFDKALELNDEMEKIATEIDYQAMLQITKQFYTDLYRLKGDFIKSKIYLKEHFELAKNTNDEAKLITNKLLAIDLYFDKKELEKIPELLDEIQTYIDKTGEIRLQPRINKKRAEYFLLKHEEGKALELFQVAKDLAKKTEDGETLVDINNLLVKYYLQENKLDKAKNLLDESSNYTPLPYPYLLLKSKLENKKGNKTKALQLANECKRKANQWWKIEDERYLYQLSQ